MGIPKFFGWFKSQDTFRPTIHRYAPNGANIFAIDVNGLIHQNCQKVFGYGRTKKTDQELGLSYINGVLVNSQEVYDRLEQEAFKGIFDDIVGLTKTIRPNETLIIAVDGVAPRAKINQQQNRRYKAASEKEKSKIFDSNNITPGTDFMFRLDEFINETLEEIENYTTSNPTASGAQDDTIAYYAQNLPNRIIYSNHLTPGEGEHKISEELRKIPGKDKIVVVHGADADLLMIYLLHLRSNVNDWNKCNNIFLFRDNYQDYGVETMVNLRELEEILRKYFPSAISPNDDFVVILYLNGNDFLPHFPVFERIPDALATLIGGYRMFLESELKQGAIAPFGITDGYKIDWTYMAKFMQYISVFYNNILLSKWAENKDRMITTGFPPIIQEATSQTTQVTGGKVSLVQTFNPAIFNSKWYEFVFSPKIGDFKSKISPNDISRMIQYYIEGVAWVYSYYKTGVSNLNLDWYYPYHYTPLFTDLNGFIQSAYAEGKGNFWLNNPLVTVSEFLNPLTQLVMVLPPTSVAIVPAKLRNLYSEGSLISDMLPRGFLVDSRGKMEEWQGFALLPMPIPERITLLFPSSNITQEEMDLYAGKNSSGGRGQLVEINRNVTAVRTTRPFTWKRGGDRGRGRGGQRGRGGRGGYRGGRGGQQSTLPPIRTLNSATQPVQLAPINIPSQVATQRPLIPLSPLVPLTSVGSFQPTYQQGQRGSPSGRGSGRGGGRGTGSPTGRGGRERGTARGPRRGFRGGSSSSSSSSSSSGASGPRGPRTGYRGGNN